MLVSTGNNFGSDYVELNAFQSDKEIVINGSILFQKPNADFEKAEVLEIYVPDLTMEASGISSCFLVGEIENDCYCTILKTWIKDKNTICIEKLDPWDGEAVGYMILMASLYVPKGYRKEFIAGQKQKIKPVFLNSTNEFSEEVCYVDENWVMLALSYSKYNYPGKDVSEQIRLEGLPEDVEGELIFAGDDINCRYAGAPAMLSSIKDSVLTLRPIPFGWAGNPNNSFYYGALLRKKTV